MTDGRPITKRESWLKSTLKAAAVVMALGVGTCSVAMDLHRVAWYAVFPYSYFIEIKTDLTVDGEPMELRGVARCDWVQRLQRILPDAYGSAWGIRGGILAKRLPSGGAVIAFVDPPCTSHRDPFSRRTPGDFWGTAKPLHKSARRLPTQTLLLDDAAEPTRIEWSYSKAYFEDPRGRVRYLGGTWQPMKRGARTDPREEVPWLRAGDEPIKAWGGFFATVTPQEMWGEEPAVAAALAPFTEVTKLYGEQLLPSPKEFHLTAGTIRTLYLKDGYWDHRPGGPAPDGLVLLYPRVDDVSGESIPINRFDNVFAARSRLSMNGDLTSVSPPIYVGAIYEPVSRTLLLIQRTGVSVSTNELRFRGLSHTLSGMVFKF